MADDRPPRRRRNAQEPPTGDPPPTSAPKPPPRASSPGKPIRGLQARLEQFFVAMGLPFAAAGDMHCAMVFAQRGPAVAEAWSNLAAESPAVKRTLEALLTGGAWAGAISSTVALVVPIAAHHGLAMPDPFSAVIFGGESSDDDREPEPQSTAAPRANGAAPGPAAAADPPTVGGVTDPAADPSKYPGIHNSPDDPVV